MQPGQSPYVPGQQVVLDDPSVPGPVNLDDLVVVEVQQMGLVFRSAAPQVGGAVGRDHRRGHAERDHTVGRPAAVGDLAVVVMDGDVVAEEARRVGAGVRDQVFSRDNSSLRSSRKNCASRSLICSASAFGPMNPSRWSSA